MSLAGLWETWRDPDSGEDVLSATIVVGPASDWMRRLHHRMPAILEAGEVGAWLAEPRGDLLHPAADDTLQEWPVRPRVNSSRYQEPGPVEAVG